MVCVAVSLQPMENRAVANGAITVPGAADIRLSDTELGLLRERVHGHDGLGETAGLLDEVASGRDVTLPVAEQERLCEVLDKLVMSVSARQLSSLTGLMELRGVVCYS